MLFVWDCVFGLSVCFGPEFGLWSWFWSVILFAIKGMSNARKRQCINEGEGDSVGKESGYAKLKAQQKNCQHELEFVRKLLEDTQLVSVVLAAQCEQLQMELRKTTEKPLLAEMTKQFECVEIIR